MSQNLHMTGQQLQALRTQHALTQAQIAQLVRMSLHARAGGRKQSAQIGNWEKGTTPIPPAMAELIRAKLYLLEKEHVKFEDLVRYSLDELLADIYS